MPIPPELRPEVEALASIMRKVGMMESHHMSSFLELYSKIRSGELPGGSAMFANDDTGQLHMFYLEKTANNRITITDRMPNLSEEDEARLVRQIVEEEINDVERVSTMILELQSLRAVIH